MCERMRCANCKRGVCGVPCRCGDKCKLESLATGSRIGAYGICMEDQTCSAEKRKPECKDKCPPRKMCAAVWPCMCVEETDDETGCIVSTTKCPEAPQGCIGYTFDGCNVCKVDEDGQITDFCTKKFCARKEATFC